MNQNLPPSPTCPFCSSGNYRPELELQPRSLYTCHSCGLSTLWPRKDDRQQIEYYAEEYYNGSHKLQFDESRISVYQRDFSVATRGMRPGTLLDFGCGLGHFVAMAGQMGWDAMGMEVASRAVDIAREKFGINVVQGGVDSLARMQDRFDIITMWNVLDHLNDPLSAAKAALNRLSERGRLVIRIYNRTSRLTLYKVGCAARSALLQKYFGIFNETMFSASTIRRTLLDQGFRRVTVHNSAMAGDIKGKRIPGPLLRCADLILESASLLLMRKVFPAPSLLVVADR